MNNKFFIIGQILVLTVYFVLFLSCSLLKFQPSSIDIIANDWSGKEVMFADVSDQILKKTNINRSWSPLNRKRTRSYYKFQKSKATVVGDYLFDDSKYLVIELKHKKKYKRKKSPLEEKYTTLPNHLYLLSDYKNAKAMFGIDIWLNNVVDISSFFSYSEKLFKRFEKVKVVDVHTYQNDDKDWPLWLIIESKDGQRGNVRYNGAKKTLGRQNYYFIEDPLPKNWGRDTIALVRNGGLEINMSKKQVRISQGNPDIINNTSSRHGIGQQWIYGDSLGGKTYLYFEYGGLSFIQD